jgi:hypothetical protein
MSTIIQGTENYSDGPFYLPSSKEKGDALFTLLEDFINRMAVHNHQGADSIPISSNFNINYQNFEAGIDFSWVAVPSFTGRYSANITLINLLIDNTERIFYFATDGGTVYQQFYPTYEKLTANSIKLYSIDNTITDIRIASYGTVSV